MQAMRQQNYAKGRQQGQPELLMLHCKGELQDRQLLDSFGGQTGSTKTDSWAAAKRDRGTEQRERDRTTLAGTP